MIKSATSSRTSAQSLRNSARETGFSYGMHAASLCSSLAKFDVVGRDQCGGVIVVMCGGDARSRHADALC